MPRKTQPSPDAASLAYVDAQDAKLASRLTELEERMATYEMGGSVRPPTQAAIDGDQLPAALAAASNGDTIWLNSGEWTLSASFSHTATDLYIDTIDGGECILNAPVSITNDRFWRAIGARGSINHIALVGPAAGINAYRAGLAVQGDDYIVDNCRFDDFNVNGGVGYALLVDGNVDRLVSRKCSSNRCRHATSTAATTNGTTDHWIDDILFEDWTVTNQGDAGMDCHHGCRNVIFRRCAVSDSGSDGITFQGASGSIEGCTFTDNGRHGMLIQPLGGEINLTLDSANSIVNTVSHGIFMEFKDGDATWPDITRPCNVDITAFSATGVSGDEFRFQDEVYPPDCTQGSIPTTVIDGQSDWCP
jgi:hypothetical protein